MQEVIFTFKSFKAEIPNYLQSLRFRKLSVNTIRSYEYDLKHWTEALTVLLDENGEITKNDISKLSIISKFSTIFYYFISNIYNYAS